VILFEQCRERFSNQLHITSLIVYVINHSTQEGRLAAKVSPSLSFNSNYISNKNEEEFATYIMEVCINHYASNLVAY
jgi:hypothetical protein